MTKRLFMILLAVCVLAAAIPAIAEEDRFSNEWLRCWAAEILAEALEKPVAGDQLSLPLSGKVILVYHDCYWGSQCNVYRKTKTGRDDPHPEAPFFQPVYSNGEPVYPSVPVSIWAETVEDCDWLIVYGGFETDRDKNFYFGDIDRVTVETRVYVLNAREKRAALLEVIGVDRPERRTTMDHTSGWVMHDEAEAFISRLLTDGESAEQP